MLKKGSAEAKAFMAKLRAKKRTVKKTVKRVAKNAVKSFKDGYNGVGSIKPNLLMELWFAVHNKNTSLYNSISKKLDAEKVPFRTQNDVAMDAENMRYKKNIDTFEVKDRISKIMNKKIGSTLLIEKGENPRKKPTRVLQVNRTKKGTFKKFKSVSGVGSDVHITADNFTRISNDTNGNPRYVIHFRNIADTYDRALYLAKKFGGRKYHNKQYGGGIAIQSYNIADSAKHINEILNDKRVGMHTDTKSHNIRISVGALPTYKDEDAAREIQLYADNDSQLYYQRRKPILINLSKKHKKGQYNIDKAAKLWRYYIDAAMQKYHKEFGSRGSKWSSLLSVSDRNILAHDYAVNTLEEFELGNYTEK